MARLIEGLPSPADRRDAVVFEWRQADRPTPHDFRRTMITGLSRLGTRRDTIKAVVNHAEGDITETHYDRMTEKRQVLDAWEAHVLAVIGDYVPAAAVQEGRVGE
ncbi:MAG TPA: hypothetical protein VMP03_00735 [Methylomirabilota bacterium]|nr:hypothetical protein [Methylomirabilota bacterium]